MGRLKTGTDMPVGWKRRAVRDLFLLGCLVALSILGCPVYELLGILCPCCGVTRAWCALLAGEVGLAFRYHALFPAIPMFGVLYLCRDALPLRWRRAADACLILFAVAIFVYGVLRWCGFVDIP